MTTRGVKKCDHSFASRRCPNPATHYHPTARIYACDEHKKGSMVPIPDRQPTRRRIPNERAG